MSADMSWQYIAGFFDGEGSFNMYVRKGADVRIGLYISQTSREVLVAIASFTGGKVGVYSRQTQSCNRTVYTFQSMSAPFIVNILEHILPYLIVKRRSAEIVLKLLRPQAMNTAYPRRRYTAEERQQRAELALQLIDVVDYRRHVVRKHEQLLRKRAKA